MNTHALQQALQIVRSALVMAKGALGHPDNIAIVERALAALATVDASPSLEQAITARQLAELDELGAEVARLQKAIAFWLPSVTDREDEVACRILEDAFLLVGYDGDEKSAQELGWIQFASPSPVSVQPSDEEIKTKFCLAIDALIRSWNADGDYPTVAQRRIKARADLEDLINSTLPTQSASICETCNGHGLVGGMMCWGDGQVDSIAEPCPDCNQPAQPISSEAQEPTSNQNARFAIDGAIQYGKWGTNKPPSDDHWLMEYWNIGRDLAKAASPAPDVRPVASVVPEGPVLVPIVPTEAMCAAGNDASARYVRDAGDIYRAMLSAAPAPSVSEAQPREALSDFLVTLLISVDQKHNVYSDVQTHDNSFAEVAAGFSVIKAEIDRVFAERKSCPYYPIDRAAAKRKIMRKEQAAQRVISPAPDVRPSANDLTDAARAGFNHGMEAGKAMAEDVRTSVPVSNERILNLMTHGQWKDGDGLLTFSHTDLCERVRTLLSTQPTNKEIRG